MKKILSSIICFALFLPLAAGNTNAKSVYNACQNTGIAGYYAFMSDAAFKMVHAVFQDSFKTVSKAAKKEPPAKKEQEKNKNMQAVISSNIHAQKTFKPANIPIYYVPAITSGERVLYGSQSPSGTRESFWLILLMILMILSVRKKDNCAIFASNVFFKHPAL